MPKIKETLSQPSSYAGLAILSMNVPALIQAWQTKGDFASPLAATVAGLVAVFAPERGMRPPAPSKKVK